MDDTLKRLEEKTDQVLQEIVEIKIDVATHILRTNLLQETVELMKRDVDPLKNESLIRQAEKEKAHERALKRKDMIAAALKILSVSVAILAFIYSLHK